MLPNVWTEPFDQEIMQELRLESARRFRRFQLPESQDEWDKLRPQLLRKLQDKLKLNTIDHNLDLDCRETSVIPMDGYDVRQLYFRSTSQRYVTASLYVPHGDGPFPAVVNSHGHWPQGHIATSIQRIAHILAKAGYVVLSMDAFGSGDRSTVHGEFEYHGAMLGGMLFNIGEPLMGIQIIDNMRGVDLLCSLPYVDPDRIGATGGSGGGNQTMYLAAFDQRIGAAVPVVSVGTYQSYVGGTNCVCELLPDGLTLCEESAILALTAPRALLLCNALHDSNPTFFVSEMARSLTEARKVYAALGAYGNLTSYAFNAPHSYPPDVHAAMLGFFDFHLRQRGHGQPAELPPHFTLPEEKLMVFPKGKRNTKVTGIQDYIQRQALKLKATANGTPETLQTTLMLNGETIAAATYLSTQDGWQKYTLESTSGRVLPFLLRKASGNTCQIFATPDGKNTLEREESFQKAMDSQDSIIIFDLWGTGEGGLQQDFHNGLMPLHQFSRALIWLGRRLMGEWTADFILACQFARQQLPSAALKLNGLKDAGLAALYCNILNPQLTIRETNLIDAPYTLVYNGKPNQQFFTMACCLPDILAWGDLDHARTLAHGTVHWYSPRNFDGTLKPKHA